LLVGALTIGSASPHLVNALGGVGDWKLVIYSAAGFAALGGLIALLFIKEGPYRTNTPKFNWKYVGEVDAPALNWCWPISDISVTCGNCLRCGPGSRSSWRPAFAVTGLSETWASAAAFGVIAYGRRWAAWPPVSSRTGSAVQR
jgi:hypothetical protein